MQPSAFPLVVRAEQALQLIQGRLGPTESRLEAVNLLVQQVDCAFEPFKDALFEGRCLFTSIGKLQQVPDLGRLSLIVRPLRPFGPRVYSVLHEIISLLIARTLPEIVFWTGPNPHVVGELAQFVGFSGVSDLDHEISLA